MGGEEYIRIVDLFYEDIMKISFAICKDIYDAEDIAQTTFIKLLNHSGDFDDDYHVKRWLIKVAVNECRILWKSPWKSKVDYFIPEKSVQSKGRNDEEELVSEAVGSLKKKYREVVHLFYYEEYSAKEIAEILDIKENAVFKRLQRVREIIKKYLLDKSSREEIGETGYECKL